MEARQRLHAPDDPRDATIRPGMPRPRLQRLGVPFAPFRPRAFAGRPA